MRILFTTFPGLGHVFPMIPMAWALRSAGHEVRAEIVQMPPPSAVTARLEEAFSR